MTWPSTTALTTLSLDADTDLLTAARLELKSAVVRLNLILANASAGDTLITDSNDADYAKLSALNIFVNTQTLKMSSVIQLHMDIDHATSWDSFFQFERLGVVKGSISMNAANQIRYAAGASGLYMDNDCKVLLMSLNDINYNGVSLATKDATSVTGSRGGNAALASLLTSLAASGLIVDNTTA